MRIKTVAEKVEADRAKPIGHEIVDELVDKELAHYRQLSVSDLISQCNDAVGKMGVNNPHKILIYNCALCMRQLVDRLEKHENPQGLETSGLVV